MRKKKCVEKKIEVGNVVVYNAAYNKEKVNVFWTCLSEELRRRHIFLTGKGELIWYSPFLFCAIIA